MRSLTRTFVESDILTRLSSTSSLEQSGFVCCYSKNNSAIDISVVDSHDREKEFISQWDRFSRSHQIGSGTFGNVFLCHDMLPVSPWYRQAVAVKVVSLETLSESEVASAMNEVAILRHLQHPNILQYIDSFIDNEKQLCLVSEYMDNGDLSFMMRRCNEDSEEVKVGNSLRPRLREEEKKEDRNVEPQKNTKKKTMKTQLHLWIESYRITDIVRQCLEALSYIHNCYIIHRDIKPANVYVGKNGVVKLGDFGVSKLVDLTNPMATTFIGTPFYLSPELCLGEPYSFGADIWALGVLTYEMYCMKLPFAADNVLAQIHVVTEGQYDKEALYQSHCFLPSQEEMLVSIYGSAFLHQEETLHRLVVELVERMLVLDPLKRPSASQLLREFFVNDPSRSPSPTLGCLSLKESMTHEKGLGEQREVLHSVTDRISTPSDVSTKGAAALPASRVSVSHEALVEMLLPVERQSDMSRMSSPSVSSTVLGSRAISPLSKAHHEMDVGDAVRPAKRHVVIQSNERIPWLRDAKAFSSLSLQEGYDDDVVRVDWTSDDHFSLVSPHRKQRQLSLLSSRRDVDKGAPFSMPQITAPMLGSKSMGKTKNNAATSMNLSSLASEASKSPVFSDVSVNGDLNTEKRRSDEQEQQQQQQLVTVGRCQGLSTETLEMLLRKKITGSYIHRQRQLKVIREANAARENERARMREELNRLYAKSFSQRRREIMSQRGEVDTCDIDDSPVDFSATLHPNLTALTSFKHITALTPSEENKLANSIIFERAFNRLNASSSLSLMTIRCNVDPLYLSNEVTRIATDAADVAERCAKWTMQPPTRLDFSNRQTEETDRRSTSSVVDSQRGTNMDVYNIPVTLCIVLDELQVGVSQTSPPSLGEGPVGKLTLPISVILKPISQRTRLDGIVWRVKETLKAYGLDHALLFPLDIDNSEEVDAEELRLRYVDHVGDVIAITEASDWLYVKRDWCQRNDFTWVPLYMVTS